MRSLNLNPVTKNLLILNILVYITTIIANQKGMPLAYNLSAHYFNSPLFEPFQIVTHMFVHDLGSIRHIFMNMFILFVFGNHLESIWGAKKFFFVYIASGLGALLLYAGIGTYEIMQLKAQLTSVGYSIQDIQYPFGHGLTYTLFEYSWSTSNLNNNLNDENNMNNQKYSI